MKINVTIPPKTPKAYAMFRKLAGHSTRRLPPRMRATRHNVDFVSLERMEVVDSCRNAE